MAVVEEVSDRRGLDLTRGAKAALLVLAVGITCRLLGAQFEWLVAWPDALTVPMTEWVGAVVSWFLGVFKPVARFFSFLLGFPMEWVGAVLGGAPWPLIVGAVTAIGWLIGGVRLAALGFLGLGFVVISGYWAEGMNTLALVTVSVPLAVVLGMAIGILAFEVPRLKSAVNGLLDVMQTVPTFAYLTPLIVLFGFGPVVGLIASAIYAAPPMARNVLLGLERVEPEIREAAVMSGGTRRQQLFLIEIPAAGQQIMVGFNQCLMAALSMVIIAAVIGGFKDIGWEVLLTMRKAQFGPAFLAGTVIVVFAVVIDRMSAALAEPRPSQSKRVAAGIFAAGVMVAVWSMIAGWNPSGIALLDGVAEAVDKGVGTFTANNGAALDSVKNSSMFFGLLPLRIGLADAVLPFTWGFQWTAMHSMAWFAAAAVIGGILAWRDHVTAGAVVVIAALFLEIGIAQAPWPLILIGAAALGWVASGWKLVRLVVILLGLILISGLWERAMLSLYLSGASVAACALVGGVLGFLSAMSARVWTVVRPICDMLQTIPLFVFLIPVLMFFQIGEFSAFLAICMYAVVPMIRYTRQGLVSTPEDMIEAATASGAGKWQTMFEVRGPYAAPTILLGLNQTILYAFAMLVIAALIGTTGLGQSIYLALGQADVGLGVTAGAAMAILALVADRLVQGFAEDRRKALGL
ncbi:glycine betaine/proline transport system permease protein [Shimia isoporae]|uniref:Glycine betaine/proline transport system permease protein n=1 Tax=Shimia isoporae TaxID=647720 RepID=A0A4R1N3K3_9RHOB|nr:ABC transporter permease subunit [Shimia isoporae]TCL01288.1 glycine betaine/proline transport system permease protein [Shimia isoporae]